MRKKEEKNKLEILKESEAILRVIYWFFAFPDKEISLSDLAKSIGISKTNANKIVKRLSKEGFLRLEVMGKIWRISSDQSHPYNTTIKISFNLGQVYQSGIIEEIITRVPNARSITLFGSYRKGDDNNKSDLDIAAEISENKEPEIIPIKKIDIGYRKGVPVNLYIFSRKKIDLNLFSNIANGIVLRGFLEVRP